MQKIIAKSEVAQFSDRGIGKAAEYINTGRTRTFESFDGYDLFAFDFTDVLLGTQSKEQLTVYFDSTDLFFLCSGANTKNIAEKCFCEKSTNSEALYAFFVNLLKGDTDALEKLETRITKLENDIITGKKKHYADRILTLRKELLSLKKYYEQLDSIFDCLEANDNRLIDDASARYISILSRRIDRLLTSVLNLREYVTQVREAYQAQIDIEQNDLMKLFTIITTIFLPLTLIVGWYGMNFKMPEYGWDVGYPIIIAVSIAIIAALIIYFKRKKWF